MSCDFLSFSGSQTYFGCRVNDPFRPQQGAAALQFLPDGPVGSGVLSWAPWSLVRVASCNQQSTQLSRLERLARYFDV